MKLRIWWNSNFGNPPFNREVKDIDEAKFIINLLTDYDLYLKDKIDANACGLEEYDEMDDEWVEWNNEDGQDILEVIEGKTK